MSSARDAEELAALTVLSNSLIPRGRIGDISLELQARIDELLQLTRGALGMRYVRDDSIVQGAREVAAALEVLGMREGGRAIMRLVEEHEWATVSAKEVCDD